MRRTHTLKIDSAIFKRLMAIRKPGQTYDELLDGLLNPRGQVAPTEDEELYLPPSEPLAKSGYEYPEGYISVAMCQEKLLAEYGRSVPVELLKGWADDGLLTIHDYPGEPFLVLAESLNRLTREYDLK